MSNLVEIAGCYSDSLQVVTGNDALHFIRRDSRVNVSGVRYRQGRNIVLRVMKNLYMQLRIALLIAMRMKIVDVWIFFIGGEGMTIPMLTATLGGKTTVLALAGSYEQALPIADRRLSGLARMLSNVNRKLSDRVVVYSPSLVSEWQLEAYESKVSIAHHHFVDFTRFEMRRSLAERRSVIGYVGRLSEEKGILQFVRAIPIAINRDPSLEFVIAGVGPLENTVRDFIKRSGLANAIRLTGWIKHDDLPKLLNELKLIVVPSRTEGLPSTILEAMACGTPVLATRVGAIPDVIKEGETGFIIESDSTESIASNMIRALQTPGIERIAIQARDFVQTNFTFENAAGGWKRVLEGTVAETCARSSSRLSSRERLS